MKKRFLVEQDVDDLDDFRKILLLNKKKLDFDEVTFYDKNGDDYPNIIEMRNDGIQFNFEDLEEFLKFFFQETYEKGSDYEYEAINYDQIYYGSYDFYGECSERSYDDFSEGYSFGYLCENSTKKLKELVNILDPSLTNSFIEYKGKLQVDRNESEIAKLLSQFFKYIDDEFTEIICEGKDRAVRGPASELIKDTFCDGLKPFGVVNYTNRLGNCFSTYFISWGSLVQIYIEKGEFDEPVLDLLFSHIEKNFKDHPGISYEIEDQVFDNKIFKNYACDKFDTLLDNYIERAYDEISPEYLKTMSKISSLGLFSYKEIPNSKYFIQVMKVDSETLKISFKVGERGRSYESKLGISDLNNVIAIATQPGLFNPMDYRIK